MPRQDYRQRIETLFSQNGRVPDPHQRHAMDRLAILATALAQRNTGWRERFRKTPPPRGIFLWGGVGRGKTCLLDALIAALPNQLACRYHQHAFLDAYHRATGCAPLDGNAFQSRIRQLVGPHRLLVLDEFHAYDPADAAILGRAFVELQALGVTLALNANHLPTELWPETTGHRQHLRHFTPLIDFIQQHCEIIEVEGGRDYRLDNPAGSSPRWWSPDTPTTRQAARSWASHPTCIQDFTAFCRGPLKHTDYSAYCAKHAQLVLLDLPQFTPDDGDSLRRLIWLLDSAWEANLPLAVTAATPLASLFVNIGPALQSLLGKDLRRTQSRLAGLCAAPYCN
ncbi:MAG: cell division protein ZapE [Rhodocyclales bacterium GT-UBC]|nr:MAG: cell division protein ZapE [Rhodocyclales bacterium GT-UBC]